MSMSSFPGKMREYSLVSLDRFDGVNLKSSVYFLSHCHSDHTVGLASSTFCYRLASNSHMKLYCTSVTKDLLVLDERYTSLKGSIVAIDTNEPEMIPIPDPVTGKVIERLTVTLLPAAHCPGSVMILFEGAEGTVLYTGDFRLTKDDLSRMTQLRCGQGVKTIKSLYVDTTFFVPQALFIPSRDESCAAVRDIVQEWITQSSLHHIHIRHKANLGYESLFSYLAEYFGMKVHVSQKKFEQYQMVGDMARYVTADPSETQLHACYWMQKSPRKKRSPLPCGYGPAAGEGEVRVRTVTVSTLCFVQQVGLEVYAKRYSDTYFRVCYSFHSSYSEVRDMLLYLRPLWASANVIPIGDSPQKVEKRLKQFLDLARQSRELRSSPQYRPLGKAKSPRRRGPLKLSQQSSLSQNLMFCDSDSPQKSNPPPSSSPEFKLLFGGGHDNSDDAAHSLEPSESTKHRHGNRSDGDPEEADSPLAASSDPDSFSDSDEEGEGDSSLSQRLSPDDVEDMREFVHQRPKDYGTLLGYISEDDDVALSDDDCNDSGDGCLLDIDAGQRNVKVSNELSTKTCMKTDLAVPPTDKARQKPLEAVTENGDGSSAPSLELCLSATPSEAAGGLHAGQRGDSMDWDAAGSAGRRDPDPTSAKRRSRGSQGGAHDADSVGQQNSEISRTAGGDIIAKADCEDEAKVKAAEGSVGVKSRDEVGGKKDDNGQKDEPCIENGETISMASVGSSCHAGVDIGLSDARLQKSDRKATPDKMAEAVMCNGKRGAASPTFVEDSSSRHDSLTSSQADLLMTSPPAHRSASGSGFTKAPENSGVKSTQTTSGHMTDDVRQVIHCASDGDSGSDDVIVLGESSGVESDMTEDYDVGSLEEGEVAFPDGVLRRGLQDALCGGGGAGSRVDVDRVRDSQRRALQQLLVDAAVRQAAIQRCAVKQQERLLSGKVTIDLTGSNDEDTDEEKMRERGRMRARRSLTRRRWGKARVHADAEEADDETTDSESRDAVYVERVSGPANGRRSRSGSTQNGGKRDGRSSSGWLEGGSAPPRLFGRNPQQFDSDATTEGEEEQEEEEEEEEDVFMELPANLRTRQWIESQNFDAQISTDEYDAANDVIVIDSDEEDGAGGTGTQRGSERRSSVPRADDGSSDEPRVPDTCRKDTATLQSDDVTTTSENDGVGTPNIRSVAGQGSDAADEGTSLRSNTGSSQSITMETVATNDSITAVRHSSDFQSTSVSKKRKTVSQTDSLIKKSKNGASALANLEMIGDACVIAMVPGAAEIRGVGTGDTLDKGQVGSPMEVDRSCVSESISMVCADSGGKTSPEVATTKEKEDDTQNGVRPPPSAP